MAFIATQDKKLARRQEEEVGFSTSSISTPSGSRSFPDQITNWSYGEVKKPETINYHAQA